MRFRQLDHVQSIVPWERIVAVRTLRADEDYLRDHFPLFPVMPGVLMLEALYQAACWLVRVSDNFQSPLVVLEEVRNAKFADFVQPGQSLEVLAEVIKRDGDVVTVKASGSKGESVAVSAKLTLRMTKPAVSGPEVEQAQRFAAESVRQQWETLSAGLAESH